MIKKVHMRRLDGTKDPAKVPFTVVRWSYARGGGRMLAWTRSRSSSLVANSLGNNLRCAWINGGKPQMINWGHTFLNHLLRSVFVQVLGSVATSTKMKWGRGQGRAGTASRVGLGWKHVTAPNNPGCGSCHNAGECCVSCMRNPKTPQDQGDQVPKNAP